MLQEIQKLGRIRHRAGAMKPDPRIPRPGVFDEFRDVFLHMASPKEHQRQHEDFRRARSNADFDSFENPRIRQLQEGPNRFPLRMFFCEFFDEFQKVAVAPRFRAAVGDQESGRRHEETF